MKVGARTAAGLVAAGIAIAPIAGMPPMSAAAPLTPVPTPVTDHCPHRVGPPPPVDESEVVAPGAASPTPLPVPATAVGGERLAGCGVVADPALGPVPPNLTSAGWLIADLDSGHVIAAKDPHGRYRPASTIKVLLALVALDELDLDTPVVPTAEDWGAEGDSCGMGPGGHYTTRDLLTGLIVVSGNDCAHALARELGGVEATLDKMNEKARALHALDTRAASPSGLDAAGMSSSPYDLALIFREAMRNSTFRELIALRTHPFPGYPKRPDVPGDTDHPAYPMYTSNQLLLEGYPGTLGGKTGYTDDARKTFVGAVERDGRRIMIVQMFGLTVESDSYWDQAKSLFDYGFRAPAQARTGTLVAPGAAAGGNRTAPPTTTTTTTSPRADTTVSATGTDHPTRWSVRILIGLIAALAAIVLLLIALRLVARR
ncbi:D-alanyl-D-alanine carboxypeptidase family protein [Gordonia sp. ABSL11-1]|uniref:D-alanyl-D-alanine carboxypeptidase family protein n=1 Tax=Gordonia sp. ABSL11-1 TaxID=3053924 RepID=UPI0025747E20|nr:D-alanyl-D-alanine carboxypeptidase family protein [Gordonia sp. ABSL11-1]MDL9945910.1 D-alanyl-D-alanine carboxypeptidase family protein [Gordonia sp. ABSL11-1]